MAGSCPFALKKLGRWGLGFGYSKSPFPSRLVTLGLRDFLLWFGLGNSFRATIEGDIWAGSLSPWVAPRIGFRVFAAWIY